MNTANYANRKRKKPQKSVKTVTAADCAISNPSKRHRERLNGELERLADLLPFPPDVVSKLDKLTVLRLSVSFLRAKSHLSVSLKSANVQHPEGNGLKKHGVDLLEGELLLRVLNGFVLVVTAGGNIFYASSTIQDYLGFHQSDVIHQRVFEFVHSDDRAEFQRQLHWALKSPSSPDAASNDSASPQTYDNPELLPPENSTFLDRNFVCRLRCLLDNSSGFIALNFQGRLKSLHGQNEKDRAGRPVRPQLALFALASPLQSPSILEIRTKNFFFRTKHKLDFTPLACDAKGQMMLGYTEEELCYRGSGYQFIHAADMLHCAENHMRMMKTGESGMTVFRLLTKQNGWMWVRANARLIYKSGRPEFIVASQRVVTNEEGEENLRKRRLQVPFSYTTGEAVLYDSILPNALGGPAGDEAPGSDDNNRDDVLNPDSLLGSLMKQDKSIYLGVHSPNKMSLPFPEDDCGGIFSSSWQEGVLSLPDSSLFKHKSQDDLAEDRDADLWGFMRNMGINREDFELFQRDETFVNVDQDGRDTLPDLTDGILCYVQESLRKRSDCAFFDSARLPGDPVPGCAPSALQDYMHRPPELQHAVSPGQPPIASLWQPQQAQQSHLHPRSLEFQPLAPIQQHCLHTQPDPQVAVQAPPHQVHRLAPPTVPQQHPPPNGQALMQQRPPPNGQALMQHHPPPNGQALMQQHPPPNGQALMQQHPPPNGQALMQQHPPPNGQALMQHHPPPNGQALMQQHPPPNGQALMQQHPPPNGQALMQQHPPPNGQALMQQHPPPNGQALMQQHPPPNGQALMQQHPPPNGQALMQQHPPPNGQALAHRHHQRRQQREHSGLLFSQPVTAEHARPRHEPSRGRADASGQHLVHNSRNILNTLFHVDRPDVQRGSHPRRGRVYPDEPARALPFKNQFDTGSVSCAQGLAYTPIRLQSQSGAGIGLDAEGPWLSDLGSEAGGQRTVTRAPAWPVESHLVADPRPVNMWPVESHLVADPRPVDTDFSLHLCTTDQPFQNCSHGNHTEAGPGPRRKGDFGHSEQTKRQPSPGAI